MLTGVRVSSLECLGRGAEAEAELGAMLDRLGEDERAFAKWAYDSPNWEVCQRVWKRLEEPVNRYFGHRFWEACRHLWNRR
jgi:hypothetical protein